MFNSTAAIAFLGLEEIGYIYVVVVDANDQ